MGTAVVPGWVSDAAALCALILTLAGVFALATRSIKHVIHDEVPKAMESAIPDVTRAMVREEVERAVEPAAAGLRADILGELRPNGGSSAYDRLDRRLVALEQGQSDLMDAITTPPIPREKPKRKQ